MDHSSQRFFVAALVIAASVGAAVAQGDRPDRHGHMTFETLDFDGSGEIDTSDLEALRAERFAALDADGDGAVTEEEFVAQAQRDAVERAVQMFTRMDADGDGTLSRDALEGRVGQGMPGRLLMRADGDESGGVSAEEFEAFKSRMAEFRGKGRRHRWGRSSQ